MSHVFGFYMHNAHAHGHVPHAGQHVACYNVTVFDVSCRNGESRKVVSGVRNYVGAKKARLGDERA